MPVENIGEIRTYLDTNKENADVKTYLEGLKVQPTLEAFKARLSDPDYKSFMDSENDKHSAKSLETWKTNNLSTLIAAEVKKLHPDLDPKDIKYKELEDRFNASEKEKLKEALTNKALKLATEKKLPLEILEYFIGADETITTANLVALEKAFKPHVEALVAERLKGGYVPPISTPTPGTKNPFKQGPDFNLTEQGKIYTENPALAAQLIAQAK